MLTKVAELEVAEVLLKFGVHGVCVRWLIFWLFGLAVDVEIGFWCGEV